MAEKAEGILRVEVWLKAQKTIRDFTEEIFASEQIADLSKNSEKIFLDTFMRIIPTSAKVIHKISNSRSLLE